MDQARAAAIAGPASRISPRNLGSGALISIPSMCHMKRTTVRELHLQTSAIVKAVVEGESYIVEKSGVPVAEIRPYEPLPPTRRMPNREAIISKMKRVGDSGRILEEDRS